jgi:hypothetical protein
MSADKHKQHDRAIALLQKLRWVHGEDVTFGSIAIHCEGGRALEDPLVQWILKKGYGKIRRGGVMRYRPGRKFGNDFRKVSGTARTSIEITEEGKAFLELHCPAVIKPDAGKPSYAEILNELDRAILDDQLRENEHE